MSRPAPELLHGVFSPLLGNGLGLYVRSAREFGREQNFAAAVFKGLGVQ